MLRSRAGIVSRSEGEIVAKSMLGVGFRRELQAQITFKLMVISTNWLQPSAGGWGGAWSMPAHPEVVTPARGPCLRQFVTRHARLHACAPAIKGPVQTCAYLPTVEMQQYSGSSAALVPLLILPDPLL